MFLASDVSEDNFTQYSEGKRSDQTEGRLTEAQTRDRRFRNHIQASMNDVGPQTRWFAMQIQKNSALLTGALLSQRGVCVGIPERKKYRLVNGYVDKKRYRFERPLAGYMFIGVNPGVNALFELYKLRLGYAVIGRGGKPYAFDPKVISNLYKKLGCGEFDGVVQDYDFGQDIEIGSEVVTNSGPYSGHRLKVISMNEGFAKVTGQFFGGECKIEVPLWALNRAAS